jgi:protein-L-isoaspartate(D-aspartate) O-methyltransferase
MGSPQVPTASLSTDPRLRMIASQLVARGVTDRRVLEAMLAVPRERFVAPRDLAAAYDDAPQRVSCGQTISQPYIVARMLELLRLAPADRVLEVGTGTGYQAALLARLAREVITMERHAELAAEARRNLSELEIANVTVLVGDGTLGAADRAPFDAIIVAAAGPRLPASLLAQLAPGGRMICPVGEYLDQRLVRVVRSLDGRFDEIEDLESVIFVPLIGVEGWQPDAAG